MSKVLSFCLMLVTVVFFFSSCEKKRGDAMACIDTGTSDLRSGKEIRFMNCSKNYDYTKWIITDNANMPIFTEITDTLKHLSYNFPAGNYNVTLNIWQQDSVSHSTVTQNIVVNNP